ncbi:SDR family oxidoreductase [Baekduia soli]|uniref:SDR family oxidoreductase n=1 Tax=Baekduia soli TaxID=496014 RepID=A0A5B8U0L1_9ACTN|nr:SDR family NAD(P)-dependent oxidoreductase [Baekduia soli]QEC46482.1 SDR family oxidoreductase [Baekduia soli]
MRTTPPRVAVVTGAASGIGLATTLRLLADGWAVLLADRNAANGAAALEAAADLGHEAATAFTTCDVATEADVEAAVDLAVSRFGRLDCIVNNAGVGGAFGAISTIEQSDWDYTFAVMARGVFLGIKHAVRAFEQAGEGGAIVNVASVAGLSGGAGPQAYSAAKAAVISLTQTTAVELAPQRIRVNAVAPGPVLTPLLARTEDRVQDMRDILETTQPWPDPGRPEDVAAVIAFLAGPDAGFVTGETIAVDGGQTAAGPAVVMERLVHPRARGLTGVSHGSTGLPTTVHRRPPA